jgi:hypothetical protein
MCSLHVHQCQSSFKVGCKQFQMSSAVICEDFKVFLTHSINSSLALSSHWAESVLQHFKNDCSELLFVN